MEDTTADVGVDRNNYYSQLDEFYAEKKSVQKKPWSSKRVEEVLKILSEARAALQNSQKRTNEQHYFGRLYDIIEIGGIKKIIKKRLTDNDPITFVVPFEEFYEKLMECHTSTGHGGRDKMKAALRPKYSIPRTAIEIFVKCCTRCAEKKGQVRKGLVVKPILSKDWNHRGQVDLIDLQSTPDGDYKWLLNYQDHLTKFVHLRPLKTKRAEEVAFELLKIFLEFGAPKILQSDNGREFVNHIIKDLLLKWLACKIINGRPRHPQSQGSVERSNQDVENMLRAWLQDNNTQNWSLGCYFVQWHKNSSIHRIIGRSPYKALFGVDFQVGLYSTTLPNETVANISTEEELENMLHEASVNSNESDGSAQVNSEGLMEQENVTSNSNTVENNTPEIVEEIYNLDDIPIVLETESTNNNVIVEVVSNTENNENSTYIENKCIICLKSNSPGGGVINETGWKCNHCCRETLITSERLECTIGQKRAAEKMIQTTKKKLKDLQVGENVSVTVPKFDRGPLDPKNVLGVIVDARNGVYQIGTENGRLNRWFPRDEINPISAESSNAVTTPENSISLREAVAKVSKFGGQGFKKCLCKPSKMQCHTNRCLCFKARVKCNSRCHYSGPCSNK